VARSSTTSDVFNAIAEAHRREVLDVLREWLVRYERAWNDRMDRVDDYLKELQQGERQ
jgi:hypothetical protein